MDELKRMIEEGEFFLTSPVERLPAKGVLKPMRQREVKVVKSVMTKAITVKPDTSVEDVAKIIIRNNVNHLPVVDDEGRLVGIVTSWDVAKAVAMGRMGKVKDVMTRKVITALPDEPVESAARKMERYNISALPVVDSKMRVLGLVTSEDLSKLLAR